MIYRLINEYFRVRELRGNVFDIVLQEFMWIINIIYDLFCINYTNCNLNLEWYSM